MTECQQETVLNDAMFQTPQSIIRWVLIDVKAALGESEPLYFQRGEQVC